jgi:hypothetical protein
LIRPGGRALRSSPLALSAEFSPPLSEAARRAAKPPKFAARFLLVVAQCRSLIGMARFVMVEPFNETSDGTCI